MTPEKKVKDRVVKELKKYGVYYFFPATGGYGRSGVPDIICCWYGRFIAIECKAGAGQSTALQKREQEKIRAAGGFVYEVRESNMEEFIESMKHLNSLFTDDLWDAEDGLVND